LTRHRHASDRTESHVREEIMRIRVGVSIALLLMALVAPAHSADPVQLSATTQHPTVELPAPLARVLTDYEAAWRAKDAAALAALFAEDGFVLASGNPPVRGRAQVEKHYTGAGGPLYLRAIAYATEGSVGWILGGYTGSQERGDEGKFTLTLKKGAKGRWLIMSDMDNMNSRRTGGGGQ
jgi:ketosteroid isomerase-like protein